MSLMRRARVQFNLKVARDGREALNLLRELKANDETVDLTLLDINMPDMDGFEFLEQVRKEEGMQDLPVVMCTGSTYSKDVDRAESLGVAGYLVKPASFARLKPIIEQIPALRLDPDGEGYRLLKAA
jgi:two-component system CheB/CheR fusion protein